MEDREGLDRSFATLVSSHHAANIHNQAKYCSADPFMLPKRVKLLTIKAYSFHATRLQKAIFSLYMIMSGLEKYILKHAALVRQLEH